MVDRAAVHEPSPCLCFHCVTVLPDRIYATAEVVTFLWIYEQNEFLNHDMGTFTAECRRYRP